MVYANFELLIYTVKAQTSNAHHNYHFNAKDDG